MKSYIINALILCLLASISRTIEGYPTSGDVKTTSDVNSLERILLDDSYSHLLNDARKRSQRNALGVLVQSPPESDVTPNNATNVEEKPKVVKKMLASVENSTDSTPSTTNETIAINKNSSTSLPQKANATEAPIIPQASQSLPVNPPVTSAPSMAVTDGEKVEKKNGTVTATKKSTPPPGAKQRALIVFGILGILSALYLSFKIHKRRKQRDNNDLSFYPNNNEQFKYGVLLSNENDDNLELTNLPQSIDSDDEEIEIFDLESKKFMENEHRNTTKYDHQNRNDVMTKDDVEIIDLNLPGTSESDPLRLSMDDNLLNFDDIHLKNEFNNKDQTSSGSSTRPKNHDDFFDIL